MFLNWQSAGLHCRAALLGGATTDVRLMVERPSRYCTLWNQHDQKGNRIYL